MPAPPEHRGPGALLGVLLHGYGHLHLQDDDHLVQAEDDRGPGGGMAPGLEEGPQVLTGGRGEWGGGRNNEESKLTPLLSCLKRDH